MMNNAFAADTTCVRRQIRRSREYVHAVRVLVWSTVLLGLFGGLFTVLLIDAETTPLPTAHDYSRDTDDFMVAHVMQNLEDSRVARERESAQNARTFFHFAVIGFAVALLIVWLVQGNHLHTYRKNPEAYRIYRVNISHPTVSVDVGFKYRRTVFRANVAFRAENGKRVKKQIKKPLMIWDTVDVEEITRHPITVLYNTETDTMLTYEPGRVPVAELGTI